MAAETISVWKRHPQWQLEVERWRELAETPLDGLRLRLQLESAEAVSEALAQVQLIMESATKRVRTASGLTEVPDWPTRLKACRLAFAVAYAAVPELGGRADGRTLRIVP